MSTGTAEAVQEGPWYTPEGAARYTGYHVKTLEKYVRDGLLRRGGVRGAYRYHRDDLDEFLRTAQWRVGK